jgi:hypothetical protein
MDDQEKEDGRKRTPHILLAPFSIIHFPLESNAGIILSKIWMIFT